MKERGWAATGAGRPSRVSQASFASEPPRELTRAPPRDTKMPQLPLKPVTTETGSCTGIGEPTTFRCRWSSRTAITVPSAWT